MTQLETKSTMSSNASKLAHTKVANVDVMIITFNEALNLPQCLEALQGWTRNVFVIDSGSTDATADIAQSHGATVVSHDWEGYARQKNWGLDNLPFESDWVLIVDADEVITPDLKEHLLEITLRPVNEVSENGYFINRLTYFMGRPIRHCGYFPSWNLRLFKRGTGRYEDREVHEHVIIEDPVGFIQEPMIHDDNRGLEHYVAKHNRYSTLEARALFEEMHDKHDSTKQANLSQDTRRRRWVKLHIMPYVPFPGMWRFLYMYVMRFGVLDGRAGLEFCRFIGMYDSMVSLKLREVRRQARRGEHAATPPASALVQPEGSDPLIRENINAQTSVGNDGIITEGGQYTQMQPEASPWSFKEKCGRAIWMLVGKPLFRISFHNWHGFRVRLLRLFGATIGKRVAIRPTANIEIPWMLEIEDDATVGDHAILYSLGKIQIGKRSIISQYAHLCAGTHDYADHTFKLIRTPVTIGDDAWIGADAFVGPGVHVGSLSVLGARSSTYKNLPQQTVYVGNPAKPLKERVLQ